MGAKGKRASILLASVFIIAVLIPMMGTSVSEAYSGESNTVVYHPYYSSAPSVDGDYNGTESYADLEMEYHGTVVSTEYNPQVWNHGTKWYPIVKYWEGNTYVFTGWVYAIYVDGNLDGVTSEAYLPGQVLTEEQIARATGPDGKVHVYATWDLLENHHSITSRWDRDFTFIGGTVYTNIVVVGNGYSVGANYMMQDFPYTARGDADDPGTFALGDSVRSMSGDLIIDNIALTGSYSSGSTHGDGAVGLFARGYDLVIGTRVTNGTSSSQYSYPQLFGGSNGGTVTGDTNLIIHSGTYSNVIAGSRGGTVTGDTSVVLKDVEILDTLIGASSGTGAVNGSTYVYATSLDMPGDYYEEKNLDGGYTGAGPSDNISMNESTIITGGSNNGSVGGDTHVHISGDSVVWDVQGAGRRGQSQVADTAYVVISGEAWVKHVVNGSITDGLNGSSGGVSGSNECVKNTDILVTDSAMVGSVFGAGYDTFYKATYSSMYNGGIIRITIDGDCTVGYVYGGGYRGTVGALRGDGTNPDPIDAVLINIRGGTVLYDVFGGGRGGVDKVCHNQDGTLDWGDSDADSTGFSKMFVDEIIITLTGGIVKGNVYGGGESMPVLGTGYTYESGVATVTAGTITINALGSDVDVVGDIYGGGKGVATIAGGPTIPVMASDRTIHEIPWLSNNPAYADYSPEIYSGYAAVTSSYVHINLSGTGSVSNGDAIIVDTDVFGGGMFGTLTSTYGGVIIDIANCNFTGVVYGGGMGSTEEGKEEAGKVSVNSISIDIVDSKLGRVDRGYSLFGGGAYAFTDVSDLDISVTGASTIWGDIHAGGLGFESAILPMSMDGDDRSITIHDNDTMIYGSIYGGSRLGCDRPESDSDTSMDVVRIMVLSGTIMQSIYGGGYQGTSQMDSKIYIGAPAFTQTGTPIPDEEPVEAPDHVPLSLLIHNVYGGGNLSGGTPYDTKLLLGDSHIHIGGTFENGSNYRMGEEIIEENKTHVFCIHGNLYGDGNYSLIGGDSSIIIEGYDQYGDHSLWSIQRADTVRIDGCHLEIRGAADGGSLELTQELTFCRIGTLTMANGSHLELHAETAMIGRFDSTTDGTTLTTRNDLSYDPRTGAITGNQLTLYDGRIFSVLGDDDMGYIDGNSNDQYDPGEESTVNGYTVLSRGGDSHYFGAYVMSSYATDDAQAGFMVQSGESLVDAMTLVGDGKVNYTRTWYIVGHVEIGKTWTFQETVEGGVEPWKVKDSVNIPRMGGSDTVFAYNGVTNDPLAPGTLFIVTSDDYVHYGVTDANATTKVGDRMFFDITMSGDIMSGGDLSATSHSYDEVGQTWNRVLLEGYEPLGGIGINLVLTSSLLSFAHYGGDSHLGMSGVVGDTTISFLELATYTSGGSTYHLPVNMVDVEVTLYVEPRTVGDDDEIELATVINVFSSGDLFYGTGYISLPSIGSMTEYSVSYLEDSMSNPTEDNTLRLDLTADDQHLNQLGWVYSPYSSTPLTLLERSCSGGTVTSSVLTEPTYFGTGGIRPTVIKVQYERTVNPEDNYDSSASLEMRIKDTVGNTYHVKINVQMPAELKLKLDYTTVYGSVSYTLVRTGDGTSDSPFKLSWSTDPSLYFMDLDYGSTLEDELYYVDVGSSVIEQMTVHGMMDLAIGMIPNNVDAGNTFDYSLYFSGWYQDTSHTRQCNPAESVLDDMTLYAGFGITIRFNGEGVNVTPQTVVISPGTSLHDNGIYNVSDTITEEDGIQPYGESDERRTGYNLTRFNDGGADYYSWVIKVDGSYSTSAFNFEDNLYKDYDGDAIIDLYLPWTPYVYEMTLGFSPESVIGSELSSFTGMEQVDSVYHIDYDSQVTMGFNHNVTEAVAKYGGAELDLGLTGLNTSYLSFTMPYIELDGAAFTLTVTLVSGHTLTLVYYDNDISSMLGDGEELHLTVVDATEGDTLVVLDNDTRQKDITVTLGAVSIQVAVKVGDTVVDTYQWAVWLGDELKTDTSGDGRTKYSVGLGTIDSSSTAKVCLYREVGFADSMFSGEGLSVKGLTSISITAVAVTGAGIDADFDKDAVLFEGYTLALTLVDTYEVISNVGASLVSGTTYKVIGTGDVSFACKTTSTWTLEVTFFRSNDYPLNLGALLNNTLDDGRMLVVLADGEITEIDLSDESASFDDFTGVLTKQLSGTTPSSVTCSLPGFTLTGDGTVGSPFVMTPDEFVIHYWDAHMEGILLNYSWTCLVGSNDIAISCHAGDAAVVDGEQVWIQYEDDGGSWAATRFVSGTIDARVLFSIGTASEVDEVDLGALTRADDVPPIHATVLVLEGQWGSSIVIDVFCDADLTFSILGHDVVYDVADDGSTAVLVLPEGLRGTGYLYGEVLGPDRMYTIAIISIDDVEDVPAVVA